MRITHLTCVAAIAALPLAALPLAGCAVAKTTGKVAAAPFKVAGKTAEMAGKGVYYTGKGGYYVTKGVGQTALLAGKSVYYVGRTPVVVVNGALDATSKTLRVTEQVVDLAGKTYEVSKEVPRTEIDAYFKALKKAKNIAEVVIERVA